MTKTLQVVLGLKSLIAAALPSTNVRGFDGDAAKPDRIGAGGCVIGVPQPHGDPEIDLSPLTYNYSHPIDLEVAAADGLGGDALDQMLTALGSAILADRTLGGLCTWLDVSPPDYGDDTAEAVASLNWATVTVTAEYSTENPLG